MFVGYPPHGYPILTLMILVGLIWYVREDLRLRRGVHEERTWTDVLAAAIALGVVAVLMLGLVHQVSEHVGSDGLHWGEILPWPFGTASWSDQTGTGR